MKKIIHKRVYRILASILSIFIIASSCSDNFSGLRLDSEDKMQIYDYIKSREDLSIYKELLDYTDLNGLLSTAGSYTVFVPTNEAFEALFTELNAKGENITKITDKPVEYWRNYVTYQILGSELNTNSMENGIMTFPTLYGEDYYIVSDIRASYSAIKLNSRATITDYNIDVANGLINIIDRVLLPPTTSIYDNLKESGKFSKMLAAFEKANLKYFLTDSLATILIEPDSILKVNNFDPMQLDQDELENWIKYHIIENKRYFDSNLSDMTIYSLYPEQAITFNIDAEGQMFMNDNFAFSTTLGNGINNVASNGVYHVLDTTAQIVEQLPATILHSLYGGDKYGDDGELIYSQNVFTNAPAFIYEDTGGSSYHQGKVQPIAGFDGFLIGDYFWITIPNVVAGKWSVNFIYMTGNRVDLMMIHNDEIISPVLQMNSRDKAWPVWTNLSYKKMGEITVSERGDVTLYFQVIKFNRAPGLCCDMIFDSIELIPIQE